MKTGGQLRLTPEVERRLLVTIDTLSEWKIPLTGMDIRLLVKAYLDRIGVHDNRFKDNCPGPDWLKSFVKRHKLTQRLADNVKPARAEIDAASVNMYFDELERSVVGIPPQNIFNYDETNVTDNPGSQTVVGRQGLKRIERKIHHSKCAISIMYCGSAAGTFVPPMVVYKASNCYTEWTVGGPRGCVYDATTSGWFDSRCFERWFFEVFLPHIRDLRGIKVLIGDNLASHFTSTVVQAALDNDIRFVCLIPNSTHLLQPLDVAVFRALKVEWKRILGNWRRESRQKGSIPKNQFPGLLDNLQHQLKPENIKSGFKASGIHPVDREQVLKRLPHMNRDIGGGTVSEVFNEAIQQMLVRHCGQGEKKKLTRGKKITPGKPVMPEDLAATKNVQKKGAKKRSRKSEIVETSSSDDDAGDVLSSDEGTIDYNDCEQEDSDANTSRENNVHPNQWVVTAYGSYKQACRCY